MNKQAKKNGGRGIEWTDYTTNPIGGCPHGCRWMMGGHEVICYAESVAEGIASAHYPQGFAADYWHPGELEAPRTVKEPSRFFVGSMSDVFATRVAQEHIDAVFEMAASLPRHTFQFLTKNPPRLLQQEVIPPNCWIGVSTPPDIMRGKPMTLPQKDAWFLKALKVLNELHEAGVTTWISAEPLTFDIVPHLETVQGVRPVDWIVVGAGSDGRNYYPPALGDVAHLVEWADANGVAVFFKGNLRSLDWAAAHWREEFPIVAVP